MPQSSKPWFSPKRFGYGAGLPIAWQGWLVLLVCVVGAMAATRYLDGVARILAVGALIAALVIVTALKTDGWWRWRWPGGDR